MSQENQDIIPKLQIKRKPLDAMIYASALHRAPKAFLTLSKNAETWSLKEYLFLY